MEDVFSLISELVRAANKSDRDSRYVGELLYQAIEEITSMRTAAGIPPVGTPRDRIIRLRDAARGIPQAQASAALLAAADMLRDLKIVVAEGIVLDLTEVAL